jgi:Ca-activated chloride channel homolog
MDVGRNYRLKLPAALLALTAPVFTMTLATADGSPVRTGVRLSGQSKGVSLAAGDEKSKGRTPPEPVRLNVTVVDERKRIVPDLGKDNFAVYEDEVKQTVASIKQESGPVSLGILIDTSGSMRSLLGAAAAVARDLVMRMDDHNEVFLAQCKMEPELLQEFTRDKGQAVSTLNTVRGGGGTALLDGIVACADHLRDKGKNQRKALVVITDVLYDRSGMKQKEVTKIVRENKIEIYVAGLLNAESLKREPRPLFGKTSAEKDLKKGTEMLMRVADASGGGMLMATSDNDLSLMVTQILLELQAPYEITYLSTNGALDGKFRQVRVEAHARDGRKLSAHTRPGYYGAQ